MKKNVWVNRSGFIENMAQFIGTRTLRQCLSKFQKEELRLLEEQKIFTEEELRKYTEFKETKNRMKKIQREEKKCLSANKPHSEDTSILDKKIMDHNDLRNAFNKSIVPYIDAKLEDCMNNILKQIQLDKEAQQLKEIQRKKYFRFNGVSLDSLFNDFSYN